MQTMIRWRAFLVMSLWCVAIGCGGDATPAQVDDAGGDAADAPDAIEPDGGGEDAIVRECEAIPEILIAGTLQTDALADDAAQCGQASFAWLNDTSAGAPGEGLGEVSKLGLDGMFKIAEMEWGLTLLGISAPRYIDTDVSFQQYEYTTQDRGELVRASALIAYPRGHKASDEPKDIIVLLHGTTGFTDACSASKFVEWQSFAGLLASFGYVVVAPDFIGLNAVGEPTGYLHPYLVGQSAAISSFDAVRAAMRLSEEKRGNWCLNPRIVAFGGSEGGHAALWMDRLAPYYAREFELAGTVATVPPSDMLGHTERSLKEMVNASVSSATFFGTSADWYGYRDRLDEAFISPIDQDLVEALGAGCEMDDTLPVPDTLSDFFQQPLLDAAAAGTFAEVDPWGCFAAESGLTTTSVERIAPESDSYGILFALAEEDELIDASIERDAFDTLCEQGMPMEYLECAGATHAEPNVIALPEILDFIEARLAGEPFDAPDICQRNAPVTCGAQD